MSKKRYITYKGETKSMEAWAKQLGIARCSLVHRLSTLGWSLKKAMRPRLLKKSGGFKRTSPETIKKIQKYYLSGLFTITNIGKMFNLDPSTISYHCKEMQHLRKKQSSVEVKLQTFGKEQREEIRIKAEKMSERKIQGEENRQLKIAIAKRKKEYVPPKRYDDYVREKNNRETRKRLDELMSKERANELASVHGELEQGAVDVI